MNKPIFLIATFVVVITVLNSFYLVDARKQALVLQLGRVVRVEPNPGLKFKIPFLQNIVYFDKRILNIDMEPEEVIAGDDKRVIVDAFAKYRITNPLEFYRKVTVEANFVAKVMPILDSSIRAEVGKVALQQLLSNERAAVMGRIRERANNDIKEFGVEIVDVRIMRTDLPKENSESIFRRMQTEHEKEARETRAKGAEEAQRIKAKAEKDAKVILAEAERDAQISRGNADAKASAVFAQSFSKDPEFYGFYRSMQAYRNTLNKDNTRVVLSPNSDFLRLFGNGGEGH